MEWRVYIAAHEYGSVVIEADTADEAMELAKESDMFGGVSYHTREIEVVDAEVESYDDEDDEEDEEEN